MSHLNSKICLSVKGSVYLSLYSDSHRKWSSVLTPADFCFTLKPSPNPRQQEQQQQFSKLPRYGGCFSLRAQPSAHHLHRSCVLLTPFFAHLPYGQLGLRFTLVFFCFVHSKQLGPFIGHTAVAAFPGGGDPPPARDARGSTVGDTRSVHGAWTEDEEAKSGSARLDSLRPKK